MVNADLVAVALRKAVRFRNVVAHGYGGVDVESGHAAATTGLGDLEAFASQVSTWVGRRPGGSG